MWVLRPFLTKIVSFVRGILIYKQIALIWLDVDFGFVRSSINKTEFLLEIEKKILCELKSHGTLFC